MANPSDPEAFSDDTPVANTGRVLAGRWPARGLEFTEAEREQLIILLKELGFESDEAVTPPGDNATEKANTEQMTEKNDYRHELQLRDEQLRREIDQRQESFRAEQAVRDKALDERFAGFLAAQAERDKAWEKISEARFDRIEKDIGSIKTDTKKASDEVSGIKLTMAKYLGAAIVIGAVASAILGAAARHLIG